MQPLTIILATEDPALCRTLCRYTEHIGRDQIIAATHPDSLPHTLQQHNPHLVILETRPAEASALDALLPYKDLDQPQFICVSETEHGAAHAFEARVIDFLVRPVSLARFEEALHRVRERLCMIGLLEHREALMTLLQGMPPQQQAPSGAKRHTHTRPNPVDRLVLRQGNRVRFVEARHITWIEADDTYVRLHEGSRSHLINERLKNVAARLNRRQFVRIHRSTIVNLERIKEIKPHPSGGAIVVLQEGKELKMSRSYYRGLDAMLAGLPAKMRLF